MTFNFRGGVHPTQNKLAKDSKIEKLPIPNLLYLPLRQHIGPEMQPLVKKGDQVDQYQKIAEAEGKLSSCLHSPCKGIIKDIIDYDYMAGGKVKTMLVEKTSDEDKENIETYSS